MVWVLSLVTPGDEAVKIRNALVVKVGTPAEFDWIPGRAPASFHVNQARPTPEFSRIASQLASRASGPPRDGTALALEISRHLIGGPGKRVGGPIQSNLAKAYDGITRERRGYCADFTQVFSAIAIAAGLPVRSWSISFEAFGAGHTFNEIYDDRLGQWVMIDPFHSLYFIDASTRRPLSVLEVHDRMLSLHGQPEQIELEPIVEGRLPFRSTAMAFDYYRRGMPQLALSWGNNVFDYDASQPVRWSAHVSRYLERAVGILVGQYPAMLVYPDGVSERDVESLFRVRARFVLACSVLVIAIAYYGWMLVSTWRRAEHRT